MLGAYQDWKIGHTPVTTGRAPWLPAAFVQAMHAIRGANAEADVEEIAERRRLQKNVQRTSVPISISPNRRRIAG